LTIDIEEYKAMIEKTKQLHEDLVQLSAKMDGILDAIDTNVTELGSYKSVKGTVPVEKGLHGKFKG